jgi:large subunit ribosomal protein L22
MVSKATAKFIRLSPQKARLVIDLIRGKGAEEARMILKYTNKGATVPVLKVLDSAIHNARDRNETIDEDNLFVERAYVNDGPRMKRIRPAPMGRAYRYQRRMSHVTIELGEKQ